MKSKLLTLVLLIVTVILTSCDFSIIAPSTPIDWMYQGNNEAQYSSANYSILGMDSNASDEIIFLDKDDYGRTLCFLRTKTCFASDKYIAAIIITQAEDESNSSFYEFDNVLYSYTDSFYISKDICSSFFSDEMITKLKEKNDWGKPLNLDKAISREIYCSDHEIELVSKDEIEDAILKLWGDDDNTFYDPLNQYSNGKKAYLIGRPKYESLDDYEKEYYIVIFSKDSNKNNPKYVCEKIVDVYNCQEQLKTLILVN